MSRRRRSARSYRVLDLPGTYSLAAATLDEAITRDVVTGRLSGEEAPDLIVNVVDATNLRLGLRLTLELQRLGRPIIVALNLSDIARKRGMNVDPVQLAARTGLPRGGNGGRAVRRRAPIAGGADDGGAVAIRRISAAGRRRSAKTIEDTQREVRRILQGLGYREPLRARALARIDSIVMHPVAGRCCWRCCCS